MLIHDCWSSQSLGYRHARVPLNQGLGRLVKGTRVASKAVFA